MSLLLSFGYEIKDMVLLIWLIQQRVGGSEN
jgi:hypothetical protein